MATAEARRLKALHPHARIIPGDGHVEYWSELYEGNPHLSRLADICPDDDVIWLKNYIGHRPYIDYSRSDMDYRMAYTDYHAESGNLYPTQAMQQDAFVFLQSLPAHTPPRVH